MKNKEKLYKVLNKLVHNRFQKKEDIFTEIEKEIDISNISFSLDYDWIDYYSVKNGWDWSISDDFFLLSIETYLDEKKEDLIEIDYDIFFILDNHWNYYITEFTEIN